jgi:hypothetical protein
VFVQCAKKLKIKVDINYLSSTSAEILIPTTDRRSFDGSLLERYNYRKYTARRESGVWKIAAFESLMTNS